MRAEREYAHAQFLEAAGEDGTPWQGPAFEWLGHWYGHVGGDAARARQCYSRALGIDATLVGAVGWLVGFGWVLVAAGRLDRCLVGEP